MDQQYGTHAPSAQQGQGAQQNRPTFYYFDHSILHKNKIKHQTANTHPVLYLFIFYVSQISVHTTFVHPVIAIYCRYI